MNARVERDGRAHAAPSSDIAPATCATRQRRCASHERERGDRGVRLRAVDERDALPSARARPARVPALREHRRRGARALAAAQLALADEREREMRERREIAARADAPLLRDSADRARR